MASKQEPDHGDYIVRGILIGGSLGVFAALLGILPGLFWGCGLGMIAGFFAGLTLAARRQKNK